MARFGMVIDTRRCVGCMDCVVACKVENDVPEGFCRNWIVQEVALVVEVEQVAPFLPIDVEASAWETEVERGRPCRGEEELPTSRRCAAAGHRSVLKKQGASWNGPVMSEPGHAILNGLDDDREVRGDPKRDPMDEVASVKWQPDHGPPS